MVLGREGHRKRLRQKFLQGKLVDYELLELLISYAIPRIDVKPIAKTLLLKFGNIHQIITAKISDLTQIKGIGENAAVLINLISEIIKLDLKTELKDAPIFSNQAKLENYVKILFMGKTSEEFHILYLDTESRLIADDLHSTGTNDNVAVYPREILKMALELNAKFIILAHNHPEKNYMFSEADVELTDEIRRILSVVDVELLDHILASDGKIFSLKHLMFLK